VLGDGRVPDASFWFTFATAARTYPQSRLDINMATFIYIFNSKPKNLYFTAHATN
jgi:hypothetical protein